jgi:hypothetical protein
MYAWRRLALLLSVSLCFAIALYYSAYSRVLYKVFLSPVNHLAAFLKLLVLKLRDFCFRHSCCCVVATMSSNNKRAQEEAPEMGEPNKRRKIAQLKQDNHGSTMSCFEDLNNDCLVQVLSFLAIEEMNHVTLVNSRVCEARNDPSLDQTRSATIMVRRKNTNVLDFYETIASKKWARDVFASNSNKKVLHIVGCENLTRPRDVETI